MYLIAKRKKGEGGALTAELPVGAFVVLKKTVVPEDYLLRLIIDGVCFVA